jgi:hypothetical protein
MEGIMDIKSILDFLRKPSAVLVTISLASGILLFLDYKLLSKMYLLSFRNVFGIYIGAVFLISTILICMFIFLYFYKNISGFFVERITLKARIKTITALNPDEKETIVQMYFRDSKSANLQISDSTTQLLEYKSFICRASVISVAFMYFSFFLQPWVIEYISEHPEFIEGITPGELEKEYKEFKWSNNGITF